MRLAGNMYIFCIGKKQTVHPLYEHELTIYNFFDAYRDALEQVKEDLRDRLLETEKELDRMDFIDVDMRE